MTRNFKLSNIWKYSGNKVIIFMLLIPSIGSIFGIAAFYLYLEKTQNDILFTDLASRQSLLAKQLAAHVHMVYDDGHDEDREGLGELISEFDESLIVLDKGGETKGRRLSAVSPQLSNNVDLIKKLWLNLEPALILVVEQPISSPQTAIANKYILDSISRLGHLSDDFVFDFELLSQTRKSQIFKIIILVLSLNLVSIVVSILAAKRYVSERKQAEEALYSYAERQDQLLHAAQRLGSSLDIERVLDQVCLEIQNLLDCDGVTVYLLDDKGVVLKPAASNDPHHFEKVMAATLDVDNSLTGKAVIAKKGLIFNDAAQQPGAFQIPGTPVEDEENLLVVPLSTQNEMIGAITLLRQKNSFNRDELVNAESIALHVSAAVNNARNHEALIYETHGREASEEMSYDLGRIVEDSLNEIYLFDAETLKFIFINKGAKENTGYSLKEITELTPLDLNPYHNLTSINRQNYTVEPSERLDLDSPEGKILNLTQSNINPYHDLTSFKQLLDPLKTGERENIKFESIQKRKDGSEYPIDINLQLTKYLGRPTYLAIISDISDRKAQEEKQVGLELQLRQSQKLEDVGNMASGIAHDLNNILQGIYLHSDIIRKQLPEDDKLHTNFLNIVEAGNRAKDLVNQILTYSRKEGTELKPMRIQSLLKSSLRLTRASTPSTIEIEEYIDTNCGPTLCDRTQFQQIIINLCNNASHAMRQGRGVLSVSLREIDGQIENNYGIATFSADRIVELVVSDTGHGMDAETLDKIFDPFFTTKGVGEGTGLGLSIIQGIINEMQGQIEVESIPDKGSTFRILLPISSEKEIPETQEDVSEALYKNLRVLMVDDDRMISHAGKLILEDKGYTVDIANNGQEALEIFQNDIAAYDLIITDLTMPLITGLELGEEVRKLSRDVLMLLMSGNLDPTLRSEYESRGFNGFICKPWTATEMLTAINSLNIS